MKEKWKIVAAVVCVCAVVTVAYAATAGGQSDPLVTLSYLTDKFTPQVQDMVDQAVADNQKELENTLNAIVNSSGGSSDSGSFQVVTLSKGQTLVGDVGCEVMLRIGTAVCGSDGSVGLIDTTTGNNLANGGSLETNHLYMVTISTRSVTATYSGTTYLLVRGPYAIK